jgi:aspartate racemase
MPKTVGILGGMGPEATAAFYTHIIELTDASRDQEHLPVIIYSEPRIPDRTAFLLGQGKSPLPWLLCAAQILEQAGAELISMPCNTAHVFWNEIAASVEVPVLNIIEETTEEIAGTVRPVGDDSRPRIGLIATRGTLGTGLYQGAFEQRGLIPLTPPPEMQGRVQEVIEWIKADETKKEASFEIGKCVEYLERQGAVGVVLGCTELGLVLDAEQFEIPVYDSLRVLARATVRKAGCKSRT